MEAYLGGRPRTVLVMKDPQKGAIAGNYRPISCFIFCNVETANRDTENVLLEKQKGSQGTSYLLYIDKMVLREAKSRKKNLAICWLDYKAYDMIPHSSILECLELFGAAQNHKWMYLLVTVS